ncbi:hypothetical protein [Pseudomonas sp. FP2338]|uniref:hypothetical protein n=1 Tax=Pseudomonas sp. FP2338 TaxID=2954093 RepID=UPI0027366A4C|nr:hypothetical protein [Pseudomonas sp. FP2338]WLH85998.1 hypothetical protein PSH96_06005 [Pseudomonas sp. FP2338]
MQLLVDRMPSVDYDDRLHGEKFVITFSWGANSDPVPTQVVALYKYKGDVLVAGTRDKNWSSYEQAVEAGKEISDKFVAKYWQD